MKKMSIMSSVDVENVNYNVFNHSSCEDDVLALLELLEKGVSRKRLSFFPLVVFLVIYVLLYVCVSSL